jgi:hypothetical protein
MHGSPETGILADKFPKEHLKTHDYVDAKFTPDLELTRNSSTFTSYKTKSGIIVYTVK